MEDSLDAVASGEQEWVPLLERFWKPFIDLVTHTETSVSREEVAQSRELGTDPVSGKPMTVRMGRFGPFVQIGTKDDEDKPKFAGLRPGQKMDLITFAEAIELFKLPRKLGLTASGEEITTNVGRFGPYVKYGPKYVSLKTDDPYEITPERALEVIAEKEIADANRLILDFPEAKIQVLNGRYGPYITDKERNAKIPKDKDPKSLSLEECQALLAAAPVRTFGKWGKKNAKGAAGRAAAAKGKRKRKGNAAESADAAGTAAAKKPRAAPKKKTAAGVGAGAAGVEAPGPSKLAAKASKAAADIKEPLTKSGASGAPAKAKPAAKPKKSPAKKKS
jgi:DNA topoisomerase-1